MHVRYPLLRAAAGLGACMLWSGNVTAQDQKAEKAKCPVLGVEFTPGEKTKSVTVNGQKLSFCCGGCPGKFAASPEKYVTDAGNCPVNKGGKAKVSAASRLVVNNDLYYFCCANCPNGFKANPARFVKELRDPVTHAAFTPTVASPRAEVNGQLYLFANSDTKATFEKDSAKHVTAYK